MLSVPNISMLFDAWVVYKLYNPKTLELNYIGSAPLNSVYALPDVRGNSLLMEVFSEGCCVEIISMHQTKEDAQKEAAVNIRQQHKLPILNRMAHVRCQHVIECMNTGEVFNTAKEACYRHNINPAALSHHLNNKPGYKTVKGKTYRRIKPELHHSIIA